MNHDLTLEQQGKVYSYYLKVPAQAGEVYISNIPKEIRGSTDRSPSLSLYLADGGKELLFKDWGGKRTKGKTISEAVLSGDCLKYMCLVDKNIVSHKQALWFFHDTIKSAKIAYCEQIKASYGLKKPPKVKVRSNFKKFELDYWARYNIGPEQLKYQKVYPSKGIITKLGTTFLPSTKKRPTFIYDLMPGKKIKHYQLYNPLVDNTDKANKWRLWPGKRCVSQTWHTTLPERGDQLFITSGKKDIMCVNNSNFLADAPMSENSRYRLLTKYKEYDERFDRVYILLDGDAAGLDYAKTLLYYIKELDRNSTWKIIQLDYPKIPGKKSKRCKDPANVVEWYSNKKLRKLINKYV